MEQIERKWMVVYTKPRAEKKTELLLHAAGLHTYLPVYHSLRQWHDRKKKITLPLFNSYVFVYVHEQERTKVLQTPGVIQFVYWLKKPAIVPQSDIDRIKYFLRQATDHQVHVEPIQIGEKAVIQSGVFKHETVEIVGADNHDYHVIIESLGVRLRLSKLDVTKLKT